MIDLAAITSTTSPEILNSLGSWWPIIKYVLTLIIGLAVGSLVTLKITNKINIKNVDKSKREQTGEVQRGKLNMAQDKARVEDKSESQLVSDGSLGIQQKAEKINNQFVTESGIGTEKKALSKPETENKDYLQEKLEGLFCFHKIENDIGEEYKLGKRYLIIGQYDKSAVEFLSIYSDTLSLFKNSDSYKNSKTEIESLEKVLKELVDVRDKKIAGNNAKDIFSNIEIIMSKIFSTKTRL